MNRHHSESDSSITQPFAPLLRPERIQAVKGRTPHLYQIRDYDNERWAYAAQQNYFLKNDQILANMSAVQEIPATIVHGDSDSNVPFSDSVDLHSLWAKSKLIIVPGADHDIYDERISAPLIEASNAFAQVP